MDVDVLACLGRKRDLIRFISLHFIRPSEQITQCVRQI